MMEEAMEPVGVHPVTGRILETPEIRAKGTRIQVWQNAARPFVRASLPTSLQGFAFSEREWKALSCVNNFAAFWYRRTDVVEGLCADTPGVQSVQASGMMRLLRGADVNGNAVTALFMGRLSPEALITRHQMEYSLYMLLQLFENEEWQLQGVTYVETMEGFSLLNAMAMGRKVEQKDMREMMAMGADTFPMRIRSILLIHQPWYFSMFWALVRPFLKAKLVQRLRLLGSDLAALHAVVPAAVLPPAFGGTLRDEDEPADWLLTDMCRREREGGGMIGGWALPLSVEDPTGEARRQRAAAVAAASGPGPGGATEQSATAGGLGGSGASEKGAVAADGGAAAAASHAVDPDPTGT